MLKLRPEHLEAFERQVVAIFSARAVTHLRAVWPAECNALGDAGLSELVQRAIQRAGKIGLSFEYDVMRLVDLHFILGNDFEHKPQGAWTAGILSDPTALATAKMDRIYQRIEQELGRAEYRKGPPA